MVLLKIIEVEVKPRKLKHLNASCCLNFLRFPPQCSGEARDEDQTCLSGSNMLKEKGACRGWKVEGVRETEQQTPLASEAES